MANSENSKVKIILLYEYFLKHISPYDEGVASKTNMNEIKNYLYDILGEEFDRKSIYADIRKINSYMESMKLVKDGEDWIYSEGKSYRRTELKNEISIDEARLLVDAISTTAFVDTDLIDKLKEMFPTSFGRDYKNARLYSRNTKTTRRTTLLLNNIRTCIQDELPISFEYGYEFGGSIVEKTKKFVSPIALDWTNNKYYLIAIDNDIYKKTKDQKQAIRRYRIDRIGSNNNDFKKKDYVKFESQKERDTVLKNLLENAIDAFSSDNSRIIGITLTGKDPKKILQAFSTFADEIKVNQIISDSYMKGEIKFNIKVADAPTLYNHLFMLSNFEDVKMYIDTDDVRAEFYRRLQKALGI